MARMTVENVLNFKIIAKLNPLINNGARLGLELIPRLGGLIPFFPPWIYVHNRGASSSPPIG